MIEAAFLSMMPHTAALKPRATRSGYVGSNTYGTAITPKCHIQYTGKVVKDRDGKDAYEEGIIYLDDVYPVDTTWQLVIPVPGGEREVKIQSVDQHADETDYHHTAVHFGAV